MDLGIADKVALVTAGSKGLGRATALALAGEGVQCRWPAPRPGTRPD
jgi:NAD(P)-dependent dehydrogenase (short-subunit alcohol dehydrogenase family)